MFDLHRHDQFSTFDGFGRPIELAELAKKLGHNALCTTNHGNTNGLVQTYLACKEVGIKPILGVEGYFLPKWKEKTRGFHLVLIAKDLKGYGNLNRIQYEGEKQKYYNPIWDFSILEKYHEGLICTGACIASYSSQCVLKDDLNKARKYLKKMVSIFGDDFYLEIQPYKVSEENAQEKINYYLMKLADEMNIKCILTSDSHRGYKDDLDTYVKMHEIAGHDEEWVKGTYTDRYMPTEEEIVKRFLVMHTPSWNGNSKWSVDKTMKRAKSMINNLEEIYDKCEPDYLSKLELQLPKVKGVKDSYKYLVQKVKDGLKERGKYNKEYISRCKEELEVIKYHGFEDYFLIVMDYVNWAKDRGIAVGPGRGSVCNSLVAYALKITEVDSYYFGLDFRRFLRKDKKSYPDIDLDFQTSRRHEVIEYLCKKYEGHAARICSYGLYKVDNLINDLAKVCGLETTGDIEESEKKENKAVIASIKKFVNSCIIDGKLNLKMLLDSSTGKNINEKYDNILVHFSKLFNKVRYVGTHAAGVAITGGNILDYVALRIDKDGYVYTNYDLEDIEAINVIKFDILGLKTMESISDLRKATKAKVNYEEITKDKKIISAFAEGNCDGIFQFEKNTARNILQEIGTDSFDDVTAASSMNRPGPLSLKMPEQYAENKADPEEAQQSKYWDYTSESYGTIIYQEQIQKICVNVGNMEWGDADKVMKMMKHSIDTMSEAEIEEYNAKRENLMSKFISGSVKNGLTREEAEDLFSKMLTYSFNKGHAVGYTLISFEEAFYKVYYPNEYWFCKLKYARDEAEYNKFCARAVKDGSVIFLPHVNYSTAKSRLRLVEGERAIQQGLAEIKNVGDKAADYIREERKKNGPFVSYDDFYDRCKSRLVTSRVVDTLLEYGALDFDKKRYLGRVVRYNSALYGRSEK